MWDRVRGGRNPASFAQLPCPPADCVLLGHRDKGTGAEPSAYLLPDQVGREKRTLFTSFSLKR